MSSAKSCKWFGATLAVLIVIFFVFNGIVEVNTIYPTYKDVGLNRQTVRLWFFTVDCNKNSASFYAKQAVLSAQHFTNLIPVAMLQCREPELGLWMLRHGVIVTNPISSNLVVAINKLSESVPHLTTSTWHRFAIPSVIDELVATKNERVMTILENNPQLLEYVIYTDADVVFIDKVIIKPAMLPKFLAVPIQGDKWCCSHSSSVGEVHSSAGVILMNVTSFRQVESEFRDFVLQRIVGVVGTPSFSAQVAVYEFFPVRREVNALQNLYMRLWHTKQYNKMYSKCYSEVLPKVFAWEPYLGISRGPAVSILHWDGPKIAVDSCAQLKLPSIKSDLNMKNKKKGKGGNNGRSKSPRSILTDPSQTVLKQLVLYNRTAPVTLAVPHQHPHTHASMQYIPGSSSGVGGGRNSSSSPPVQAYPPPFDWYPAVRPGAQDEMVAMVNAERSFSPLQSLTSESLDGYQYATSLYFSYLQIICSEL